MGRKATGITREVEKLGRITIPIELRRNLSINAPGAMEVFIDEESIILRKYEPACTFCGNYPDGTKQFKGRLVCPDCLNELEGMIHGRRFGTRIGTGR